MVAFTMRLPRTIVIGTVVLAALALSAHSAHGQSSGYAAQRDRWSFELTPYVWAAGMNGDIEVRDRKASVDPSFSDLFKDLDFGVMGAAEVRYDRWGFLLDGLYMKLSKDAVSTPFRLFSSVDVDQKTGMVEGYFMYRPIWLDVFTLDVMAGARAWILDTELKFKAGVLPNETVSHSTSFADPLIGFRAKYYLTDKFSLSLLGDVGGFHVSSNVTWQAFGGFEWRFAEHWTALAGYRALGLDIEKRHQIKVDAVFHGPVLGISYRF
jgi:opacity protein-like surface antigen